MTDRPAWAVDWKPGDPLPLPYYSPLVTGLAGVPVLVSPDNWIEAVGMATADCGLQQVFEYMRQAAAITQGLPIEQIVPVDNQELDRLIPVIKEYGVFAFWKLFLDQTTDKIGKTGDVAHAENLAAAYIRSNVELTAALCWYGYTKYGRGALIIKQSAFAGYEMYYASQRGVRAEGQQWPNPESANRVREYNPKASCVALVYFDSLPGQVFSVTFTPEIKPAELYKRHKAQVAALWGDGKELLDLGANGNGRKR